MDLPSIEICNAGLFVPPPRQLVSGPRVLWDWQGEAFQLIKSALFRKICAPMGSGKSTLARALLLQDLFQGAATKVIAAVPQTMIGQGSFDPISIVIPGAGVQKWGMPSELNLCSNQDRKIDGALKFLTDTPATHARQQALMTHQALVLLFARTGPDPKLWKGVSCLIDEAHFVNTDESQDEDSRQKLGSFVKFMISLGNPLGLVTATWMRGDFSDILSREDMEKFKAGSYTLPFHRHMKNMNLKKITFSFIVGEPPVAIAEVLKTPRTSTIIFQRSPDCGEVGRIGKARRLQSYKDATGVTAEPELVDLVTEQGREARENRLIKGLKANQKALSQDPPQALPFQIPYVVLAMHKARLGFDMPPCDTVIVDKMRSLGDLLQRGGRGFRDYPGKEAAETVVLLDPVSQDDDQYKIKIRDNMTVLIGAFLIEALFKGPDLKDTPAKQAAEALALENPDAIRKISENVVAKGIDNIEGVSTEELVNAAAQEEMQGCSAEDIQAAADLVNKVINLALQCIKRHVNSSKAWKAEDVPFDIDLEDRPLDACLKYYSFQFGHEKLAELRTRMIFVSLPKLQKEVRRLGIGSTEDYLARWSEIDGAPANPEKHYDNWPGWQMFFGRGKVLKSIKTAQKDTSWEF